MDRRSNIKFFQQSLIGVTKQTHIAPLKPVQKQKNRLLEKHFSSCDPKNRAKSEGAVHGADPISHFTI